MNTSKLFKAALSATSAMQCVALIGAVAGVSAMVTTPAHAQDYTNVTATGRVIDAEGNGVAGASVKVISNAQGTVQTVTTDEGGNYRALALPQGTYTFEISAPGFGSFVDDAVSLTQATAGNTFRILREGSSADSGDIIVTAGRIRVSDFDRTTTGAVIPVGELAARVPIARDLTSVILLAPGTTQGDNAFGNLSALSGASVSENAYFLNGLNITDFRQGLGSVEVPFVFYDTVEVKNGGAPAEFGRFTGGFVNAISKSGGNKLSAGALFSWQPQGLYEQRRNTLPNFNEADRDERIEATFNLSGPIIKDKLFFYAFYQHNYIKNDDTFLVEQPNTVLQPGDVNPVTGQVVTTPTTVAPYSTGDSRLERIERKPYYGGKIDFIPFEGHRFEATYFNSSQERKINTFNVVDINGGDYDSRVDPDGAFRGDYTSTAIVQEGGENYVGRYTGQFTNWLTLSGAYGVNKRRDNTTSTQPDYPFIDDTAGLGVTGNPINGLETNLDKREFYRFDGDLYVSLFGDHHFKVGYDRENLTTRSITAYTGDVAYTYVNSGPTGDTFVTTPNTLYVTARTFRNGGVFKSKNEAFYAQDSYSLFDKRLTLNLGVRNDKFSNDNVNGETYYKSGSQWAPRLAFTADPFGDGRSKVYGSFGRYYLPIPANTNVRLAGAELDYTRYNLLTGLNPDNTPIVGAPVLGFSDAQPCPDTNIANCELISDGVATPTEATVSKSLKPQSVDEYILGVEQRLGERIRVGLYGTYRKLNESLEDVAIDKAVNDYCTAQGIAGCGAIWTGFHQYVLVNPGSAATITLSDPVAGEATPRTVDFTAEQLGYPKAKRTYKAITATFDREFDGVWSLSGSYTWSENKGNIEGGIRSDNGQTDSGITTAFDQPGLVNGAYGFLPGHSRHNFKLYGSLQPFEWLTIGANFQATSPRKYGCIGRVPRQVDAFAGAYGAEGFYCNTDSSGAVITDPNFPGFSNVSPATPGAPPTSLKLTPRGSLLESDWTTVTNVSLAFRLPTDAFDGTFRIDVFNLFNERAVTDLEERGTQDSGRPRGDYGYALDYQSPRFFRFQLGVNF